MSEFIATRIWPGARVERSIFGTDDPEEIWRLVRERCSEAEECFAFEVSVGAFLGLRLRDGSRIALKVHRGLEPPYLDAVQEVQRHLWSRGFPCPRPLGRRKDATLEEWRDEGVARDAHEPAVRDAMARALAELVRLTAELGEVPGLSRRFFADDDALWPVPHNVLFDFEATAHGAEWIDDIARAVTPACRAPIGRRVIGHADWSVKHFRFDGLRPTVIYDWDSLNTDREPVFAGVAAGTFTYTEAIPVALWPTADEAAAFIDAYEAARGARFGDDERAAAEAWATYVRSYAARCQHAVGDDVDKDALEDYVAAFVRA